MHSAAAGPNQPTYATTPAQLSVLLQQLATDLTDPAVTYLLIGHYYERVSHPRTRHFSAVFALQQGEVWNIEIGTNFLAFDTRFTQYPELSESPCPETERFRAVVSFDQLYQLCRKVLLPTEQQLNEVSYGLDTILYYNEEVYKNCPALSDIKQAYQATTPLPLPTVAS